MRYPRSARVALLAALAATLFAGASVAREAQAGRAPPSVLFQEIYARVETEHLFPDSKTFADAVPKRAPDAILAVYRAKPPRTKGALAAFVREHFVLPAERGSRLPAQIADRRLPLQAHIAALWPVLTRTPRYPEPGSSLLPLNRPYVVPGGRFRELYYWDSYFTMLGLVRDGQRASVLDMTRNFADLIGRYGHVPNGTRTYYLSRSQPPVFFLMVGLTAEDRAAAYAQYLPALRAEHAFWMHGAERLRPGQAIEHVVAMPDGAILNRYWDALDTPRDESYREDLELAAATPRPPRELYRDIRAAAESGWDFSSRWLADGHSLGTIETTAIVPVDLNSLLFGLERAIAEGCARTHDESCVSEFERHAAERRQAVQRYLWDESGGRFVDYHWRRGQPLDRPTVAMLYPLFVGLAGPEQARAVAAVVSTTLLAPGGILTTPQRTGQQWDAPNGWAPHQWIAVAGLNAYGYTDLARTIATRWLNTVARTYRETGKLLEKYDVQEAAPGGGGEYPLQDGFGWTNGVTREFLALYPQFSAAGGARRPITTRTASRGSDANSRACITFGQPVMTGCLHGLETHEQDIEQELDGLHCHAQSRLHQTGCQEVRLRLEHLVRQSDLLGLAHRVNLPGGRGNLLDGDPAERLHGVSGMHTFQGRSASKSSTAVARGRGSESRDRLIAVIPSQYLTRPPIPDQPSSAVRASHRASSSGIPASRSASDARQSCRTHL